MKKDGPVVQGTLGLLAIQTYGRFKPRPGVFRFFVFFSNFPNFKGKYLVSAKYSKDETNIAKWRTLLAISTYSQYLRALECQ